MISKSLLALLLILPIALCTITAGVTQSWNDYSLTSSFKLQNVFALEFITVDLQYGNNQPTGIGFQVSILDSNFVQLSVKECPITSTICRIIFDNTVTVNSGQYTIRVAYRSSGSTYVIQGSASTWDNYIRLGKITISGDNASRGANKNLIKQTFIPGDYRFHRVFINPQVTTYTVTVNTPNGAAQAAYVTSNNFVKLIKESVTPSDNGPGYYFTSPNVETSTVGTTSATSTLITYSNLPTGYYWLIFDSFRGDQATVATVTATRADYRRAWFFSNSYQTESYECPFDSNFIDALGIFRGCFVPSIASKLPCINFDNISQKCLVCFQGYRLVAGICLVNECLIGQHFKFGVCINNPIGCDIYDGISKCVKCKETYALEDGICSRIPLVCPNRFFYDVINYVCAPVSQKCKGYSQTTGLCTSCNESSEKVVEGKCVSVDCKTNQTVLNGVCIDNDPNCAIFEKIGNKCIACAFGYRFGLNSGNVCLEIICPDRFVPNNFQNCVKVSELCLTFNSRGSCNGCIPGYRIINGQCRRMESPVTCAARQYLGFDMIKCNQISELCEVFNREQRQCSKCINGFFLMFTGECVKTVECKSREYRVNNVCYQVSPTCGNWDRVNGKCLNCISADYQFYFGICIDLKARQLDKNTNNTNSNTDPKNDVNCASFQDGIGCINCKVGYKIVTDDFGFDFCKIK